MRLPAIIAILLTLGLGLYIAGCATITSGSTQSISITSNVDGASLYLDDMLIGETPFTGLVKKNQKILRIEKPGYRAETVVLSKTLEGVFWGNIIIGGTIGSLTDFASGAAYTYAPATYQVDLRADEQAMTDFKQQLAVRKFAMIFIDEISRDIAEGGGDYAGALVDLINTNSDACLNISHIQGALVTAKGNPVAFGEEMVGLL